jgi:hypothetical protein
MVLLLLDHGADPNSKAQFGSLAIDFAKDRKHDEIVKILTRAMNGESPSGGPKKPVPGSTASAGGPPVSEVRPASVREGERTSQISIAAEEFKTRCAERRGVRSSLNQPPLSDKEAAARAYASLGEINVDGREPMVERERMSDVRESLINTAVSIAKDTIKQQSHATKKAEAAALSPTLYSEVIRVAPKVVQEEQHDPGHLSVKELRRRSIAAVIAFDVTRKEEYLSEEQFKDLFQMSKSEFSKLPKWKKELKKKELGLF